MTEPRAEYTADEIMTPELVCYLRSKLRALMARGYGELTIEVKNHAIDKISLTLPEKWNGGNTQPLE